VSEPNTCREASGPDSRELAWVGRNRERGPSGLCLAAKLMRVARDRARNVGDDRRIGPKSVDAEAFGKWPRPASPGQEDDRATPEPPHRRHWCCSTRAVSRTAQIWNCGTPLPAAALSVAFPTIWRLHRTGLHLPQQGDFAFSVYSVFPLLGQQSVGNWYIVCCVLPCLLSATFVWNAVCGLVS
jgi:hypothetical protein